MGASGPHPAGLDGGNPCRHNRSRRYSLNGTVYELVQSVELPRVVLDDLFMHRCGDPAAFFEPRERV
jgi:hypothetical protein